MPNAGDRLIYANALMNRLTRKTAGPANARYTEGFNDALMRFRSMIHSAPTVNLTPWINVKDQLPEFSANTEDCRVLVLVTGTAKNTTFDQAHAFAYYHPKEGWVLEDMPEEENLQVEWWMPLPKLPQHCNNGE